jgi:3-oxoacyl-[acyl-carrier protein] reductase
MIESGLGGSIVTLASIAAKRPSAGVYSVSKAAVWMLTRSFAGELAPHGIRVNAIGPAYVTTEMLAEIAAGAVGDDPAAQQAWYDQRAAQLPLGVLPSPLDIANTALFLCSDEGASFTGSILHPDGGMTSATGGG